MINSRLIDIKRWLRFLTGGVFNTLFSYGVYFVLNIFLHYQISYFFAYISGIIIAYYINARFVFRVKLSGKSFVFYPVVYLMQYICSAFLLKVMVDFLNIPSEIAPLTVLLVLLPVSYFMNKYILHRGARILREKND